MQVQELHRGRLIDHIQLVVRDLARSKAFYAAILEVLNVPMGGAGDGFSGQTSCLFQLQKARPRRDC